MKISEAREVSTVKPAKHESWLSLPNVHIRLRYEDVVEGFGPASIAMVVVSET